MITPVKHNCFYTMHGIGLCIFPGTNVSAFGLHYVSDGFLLWFSYENRMVSISRTYGFHMKTIKGSRLKQRYGLHAKPNVPYRYAIKCKDDVRTVPTEMAWHMQEMHKSIPRKA